MGGGTRADGAVFGFLLDLLYQVSDFIFQFFQPFSWGGGEWCFCGMYGLMRGVFLWGIGCCRGRNSICRCRVGESRGELDE